MNSLKRNVRTSTLPAGSPAGFFGVPSMIDSSEVEVLYPA